MPTSLSPLLLLSPSPLSCLDLHHLPQPHVWHVVCHQLSLHGFLQQLLWPERLRREEVYASEVERGNLVGWTYHYLHRKRMYMCVLGKKIVRVAIHTCIHVHTCNILSTCTYWLHRCMYGRHIHMYMHMYMYSTHTPSHPSVADEAWYWSKHILRIGWLFNI